MSSTSGSPTDPSTPASSISSPTNTNPGLLWVTVSIQTNHHSGQTLPPSLVEDWYDAHAKDVLSCPGNGGVLLRYLNTNPSVSAYEDPEINARFADADGHASKHGVAEKGWRYLCLVKLSEVGWCGSKQFDEMPRTWDGLPREADGSVGSAFTCWYAGLRTYETVGRWRREGEGLGVSERGKWLVSLQIEDVSKDGVENVTKAWQDREGCKGWVAYRLVRGVLGYEEPGTMPEGMVLVEMEGERPDLGDVGATYGKGLVRSDVWALTHEKGNKTLGL